MIISYPMVCCGWGEYGHRIDFNKIFGGIEIIPYCIPLSSHTAASPGINSIYIGISIQEYIWKHYSFFFKWKEVFTQNLFSCYPCTILLSCSPYENTKKLLWKYHLRIWKFFISFNRGGCELVVIVVWDWVTTTKKMKFLHRKKTLIFKYIGYPTRLPALFSSATFFSYGKTPLEVFLFLLIDWIRISFSIFPEDISQRCNPNFSIIFHTSHSILMENIWIIVILKNEVAK